jgi:MFS family permease/signal transduction histidine kinase
MRHPEYFTKKEWGLVLIVGFSYFLNLYLLRGQNAMAADIPMPDSTSDSEAQKFQNFYLISNALGLACGTIIYGFFADKKSRIDVFMLSGLCHLTVCALTFFFINIKAFWAIYAWRFITGILLAGGFGIGITIIVEALPRPKRLWGSALVTAIGMLGICLYAVIAINKGFGFSDVLTVTTVTGAALSLLLLALQWKSLKPLLKKEQDSIEANTDLNAKKFFRSFFSSQMQWKSLLLLGLVCLPIQFCINFLIPNFSTIDSDTINWAYLVYYAAFFISVLVFARACDTIQRSSIIVFFGLFLQIAGILLAINPGSYIPDLPYWADCILLGLSGGVWWIITLIAVENTGTAHRASSGIFVSNFSRIIIVLLASGTKLKLGDDSNDALLLTLTLAGSAFVAALFLPKTFAPRLKENNNTDLMPQKVIENIRGAQKTLYENKDIEKYLNRCAEEFKHSIFESFNTLYFAFYTIIDKNKGIITISRGKPISDEQLERSNTSSGSEHDRNRVWNDIRDTTMLLMNHGKCLSFTNQILGTKKRDHISGILLYQAPNRFVKSMGKRSLPEGYISFDLGSIVVKNNEMNSFWEIRKSEKLENIVKHLDDIAKTAFVDSDVKSLLLDLGLGDGELCNLQRALLLRKMEASKSKRGYFAYFVAPFYTEQNGIAFLITSFPAGMEHLRRLTDAVAFVMSGIVELKVKDDTYQKLFSQTMHNNNTNLNAIEESLARVENAFLKHDQGLFEHQMAITRLHFENTQKVSNLFKTLEKINFQKANKPAGTSLSMNKEVIEIEPVKLSALILERLETMCYAINAVIHQKSRRESTRKYIESIVAPQMQRNVGDRQINAVKAAVQVIIHDILSNAIRYNDDEPELIIDFYETKAEDLPEKFAETINAGEYFTLSVSNKFDLSEKDYHVLLGEDATGESSSETGTASTQMQWGVSTIRQLLRYDGLGESGKKWYYLPKRNCFATSRTTILLLLPKSDFTHV